MMRLKTSREIREEVRKSYDMSDAELLAQFNRQIAEMAADSTASSTAIDSLRLLRDALVKETGDVPPRREVQTTAARTKNQTASRVPRQGRGAK